MYLLARIETIQHKLITFNWEKERMPGRQSKSTQDHIKPRVDKFTKGKLA